MCRVVFELLLLAAAASSGAHGLEFDIAAKQDKCLSDELGEEVVMTGVFSIPEGANERGVSVTVTDPAGKVLYTETNSKKGTFHFTTTADGEHKMCFSNPNNDVVRLSLDLEVGADARFKKVAEKEHFEPVEAALLKLEFEIEMLYKKLEDLRQHEMQMTVTTQSTQQRVMWFSFFTMFVLFAFGAWEAMYLKSYFKRKKLI